MPQIAAMCIESMVLKALNIRYGNGAAVVVRGWESQPHGEGRQLVISTSEKGRCVIHHEKSDQYVEQFADTQQ